MSKQSGEKFPQKAADTSQERLAKLRQEISVLEKKLAERKIETGVEIEAEIAKPVEEGKAAKESSESFSAPAPSAQTIQQVNQTTDAQNQVQALCDLAFQKGVDAAIETARSLNNPYVLDEFHDAMMDKFQERLKKEGKIETE